MALTETCLNMAALKKNYMIKSFTLVDINN